MKYVYPRLMSSVDLLFIRIGGAGLANCLFVYARAIKYAHKYGLKIITPTWAKFSIGPYLRKESDKRFYNNLFNHKNELSGLSKLLCCIFKKKHIESGLGNYFTDFLDDSEYVTTYIVEHINNRITDYVDSFDFSNSVAVHVRLGDYPIEHRTPIEWYKKKIMETKEKFGDCKFLLFSDGANSELSQLLSIPAVERVFFGNAIADIYAISKCMFLIGADSTFSGWGAFLGQVPCVFYRKHFGPILKDKDKEIVEDQTNTWHI